MGAAVSVLALFLGLAAGPASAGPAVGAHAPDGKSSDAGPKSGKGNEAKKRSGGGGKGPAGDGAKTTGEKHGKRPHPANESARRGQGDGAKPKANGPAHHHDADRDEESLTAWARVSEPADDATTDAESAPTTEAPSTTTTAPRDPDRFVRALSSGGTGIGTNIYSAPSVPAGPATSTPAAGHTADASPPPDPVLGGALGPPLLGAGPTPTRWAPFVPALDEPAFPAILLAALAVFLALFGRGDRRDPKLVEAVVDDQVQDVGFS